MSTLVPKPSGSDSPAQRFSAYGKGATRVRPSTRYAELRVCYRTFPHADQLALQAAQSGFAKISQLSLFNYIK